MSPRLYVEGLISLLFVLAVRSHGYAMTDDDNGGVNPYSRNLADNLMLQQGAMLQGDDISNGAERLKDVKLSAIKFPKLNIKQRKFAVNPGYMSYYNRDFETVEDERDLIEAALKRQTQEAEDIIKEDEILEEEIDPGRQPLSGGDDQMDETIMDEDILEPADSKKASAFNSLPTNVRTEILEEARINDVYFTTIVAVSSAVAVFAIVGAGICYHRLQKNAKATEDVEYPAYGVTGPGKEISPTAGGDRKLAQNAQMYHYQHQKQQMIAFDSHQNNANRGGGLLSDDESDEGEEGDYTVYECPGLATTGEMEVRNPLFSEDQTPKASSMPPTQSSQ